MRALFGVLSLLVALAIVGLVAVKQMKAVGRVDAVATGAASAAGVTLSAIAGSGSVREQAQALQTKIADDAVKALNDGAARQNEADK